MEVITQLSRMFQPDPRMIKKQVESLIDREYLERDTVRLLPLPASLTLLEAFMESCKC